MLKCQTGTCNRNTRKFKVIKENAIVPSICEISDLRTQFAFFQYQAPNISSYVSSNLDREKHEELLCKLLKSWNKENYDFIPPNAKIADALESKGLKGDIICNYCKRFICKRKKKSSKTGHKETDLECLLRHLRNSLAHGRVFIIHGGNYISILFEDIDSDKKISARIICNRADLKKWRELIITEMTSN